MKHDIRSFGALLVRVFRRRPQLSPVKLERPIEGAADDAEILLAFAAQSRRMLKRELIDGLSMAREKVNAAIAANRTITSVERAEFWFAYDELAVAMSPLSAHSIRCSIEVNAKRFPASLFTTTAILAFLAIAVFLLCIVVQSFWVAGKDLLDRADAIEALRVDVSKQASGNTVALKRAGLKADRLRKKLCDNGGDCEDEIIERDKPKPPNQVQKAEMGKLEAQLDLLVDDIDEKQIIRDVKSAELEELNTRGSSLQALLQQWHHRAMVVCGTDGEENRQTAEASNTNTKTTPAEPTNWFLRFICPVDKGDREQRLHELRTKLDEARGTLKNLSANTSSLAGAPKSADSTDVQATRSSGMASDARRRIDAFRQQAAIAEARRELASEEANLQRKTAHEVRIILGNLATYIVPLIMGLLGALAYILQLLTTQLRDHTYVPTSVSGNVVRLCLGAIAGVFGALLAPGSDAVLKGLPPLFIPFVFGYGIEILFALLNRIVKSFTQSEGTAPRPS
jgi:hypothetical protein